MVTWTAPQRESVDAPRFSLTGVLIAWPDGAPAMLRQTPFVWQKDAWHASVEVSSLSGAPRHAYGTIRLKPAVASVWERHRVNPRREAAAQLRRLIPAASGESHLGTVTLQP